MFVAVGIGYSIGLILLNVVGGDGGSFVGLIALFIPIFGAPIISMSTGLLTGLRLQTDEQSAALASGVGAFIGFVLLLFILIISAALVSDGGSSSGGGGSPADVFLPMFAFGVGVAVSGAGTTFVVKRIGI